jgi:hypothetical protein
MSNLRNLEKALAEMQLAVGAVGSRRQNNNNAALQAAIAASLAPAPRSRLSRLLNYVGGVRPSSYVRSILAPPRRNATPPRRNATPPRRNATPPRRNATPPRRRNNNNAALQAAIAASLTPSPRRNATPPRRNNNNATYRKSNFIQTNVPGNGSCFYHAILLSAMGLTPVRNGPHVRNLRTGVKRYLTNFYGNRSNNNIVASSRGGNFTKKQFLNSLNSMGCMAGQAEIMAAAHVLGRQIIVLYDSSPGMYRVHPQLTYRTGLPAGNPVFIWYNAPPGRFGSHFHALRRI